MSGLNERTSLDNYKIADDSAHRKRAIARASSDEAKNAKENYRVAKPGESGETTTKYYSQFQKNVMKVLDESEKHFVTNSYLSPDEWLDYKKEIQDNIRNKRWPFTNIHSNIEPEPIQEQISFSNTNDHNDENIIKYNPQKNFKSFIKSRVLPSTYKEILKTIDTTHNGKTKTDSKIAKKIAYNLHVKRDWEYEIEKK